MKKLLLTIGIISISTCLFSQIPVTFGPKIGLNISKLPTQITNTQNLKATNIYGLNAGLFLRISIKKFYIQPEAYFSMKGGNVSYDSLTWHGTKKIKLNTIDIPLLIGFKAVDAKIFNFRIMAGPVLSIPLNKTVSQTFTLDNLSHPANTVNENSFKNSLWAIQAGIGLDLLMFTFDFRYEWGLTKIYDQNDIRFKNNMFYLSLGWKIL